MAGNGSVEGRVSGRILAGQFEIDMAAGELYKSGRRVALRIDWIFPFAMTTVWSSLAAAPVPSTTRT